MPSASEGKDLQNPFKKTPDETNVIVKVEDEKLYLHSGILSIYSPVLREEFQKQQQKNKNKERKKTKKLTIKLDDEELEHVVTFFMFFYPEHKQKFTHGQMMITDFHTIKAILSLSEKYECDWIPKQIDDLLCSNEYSKILPTYIEDTHVTEDDLLSESDSESDSKSDSENSDSKSDSENSDSKSDSHDSDSHDSDSKSDSDSENSNSDSYSESEPESEMILLCNEFQLMKTLKHLIEEKHFRIYGIQSMMELPLEQVTMMTIAMTTIQSWTFIGNEIAASKDIIEEISGAACAIEGNADDLQTHFFGTKNDSDVVVKVGNYTLHLHSAILCQCSPVFKEMLSGNFKEATTGEIILKNKKAEHVITLFGFCYSNNLQKLTESSNYRELLALCQEYQMDWLIGIIDKYLIKTRQFPTENTHQQIAELKFAEEFNLNELRDDIVKNVTSVHELRDTDGFSELAKSTKYRLARKSISAPFPPRADVKKQEREALLKFLDKKFLS